jgi:thioredoxin reductase (NADPH)
MFRNKVLAVVGGGDTACEEALFLSRFASRVLLIHRRDTLRASHIMKSRVEEKENIEMVWHAEVVDVMGDNLLHSIQVRNLLDGSLTVYPVSGLFYAIGHVPNSQFLTGSGVKGSNLIDPYGYIITEKGSTRTTVPGFFASGDVQDKTYRQAITSAGSGCMAALDASHYLQNIL